MPVTQCALPANSEVIEPNHRRAIDPEVNSALRPGSEATTVLPGTSLQVSRLVLGTAWLGVRQSEIEAHALLDAYIEAGGNFIDTARAYSDWVPGETGRSERILGDWLRNRPGLRDRVVIATKGMHAVPTEPLVKRVNRTEARRDLEASLRYLRRDCVELYWLHRDDPSVPVEEIVDFMQAFVREGKVRFLGVSNWQRDRLAAANAFARRLGLTPFCASQTLFHAGCWTLPPPQDAGLVRIDPAYHRWHAAEGLPLIPYSTQAQGFFSRPTVGVPTATPANLQLARHLATLAADQGVTINALALAYTWHQPFPVFPIVGPNTRTQLDDSLTALRLKLSHDELAEINRINGSALDAKTA